MAEALTDKQVWNAEGYDHHARFVSDLGAEILSWLAPQAGEHILDLGCGDGALTAQLVESGAVVLGVDTSADLLQAARGRGLDVREMDGHKLTFDQEFDAVFSNAALHWMLEPEEVIDGVARALKPGGRFVAEFGGHGNVAAILTALRAVGQKYGGEPNIAGPWFYPTPAEYQALLEARGFTVRRVGLYPRPTPLKTGIEGWLQTFRKPFFEQFDEEKRADILDEVVALLRPSLCDQSGNWTADYIRIRVEAVL